VFSLFGFFLQVMAEVGEGASGCWQSNEARLGALSRQWNYGELYGLYGPATGSVLGHNL
jgi:hypothetical protein